jgi:translation elongation factor EF-1beta
VLTAIEIHNKPIELDENKQPKMSQKEKKSINEKQVKATTFGLKALEELMHHFMCQAKSEEVADFITENIGKIVEVTSIACEQEEVLIKIQAQMLFTFFSSQILGLKLPLREQYEIMYIKCVLKPILNRIQKLEDAGKSP